MPSNHHLAKLSRYIPLWQRRIPPYPVYQPGDPQIRVFLPLFWMKMIRPKYRVPPNIVHFEVHHQMTRHDVKQYLEKIYDVPVLHVNLSWSRDTREEEDFAKDKMQNILEPRQKEKKLAFVTLKDGEFVYPDLFDRDSSTYRDTMEAKNEADAKNRVKRAQNIDTQDLPPWFR